MEDGSDKRRRADLVLVERGFYESRARAQAAIAAGLVRVNGVTLSKPSQTLADIADIVAEAEHPYVSRGGVKLAAALDHFSLDPAERFCLDLGASTGGFTDVLLKRGARHVVALDVGRDQFHLSLRGDRRVTLLEGFDARHLTRDILAEEPSLIVADVSFISLALILPKTLPLALPNAALVVLVKPQFEVGRAALKKGIVRNELHRREAVDRIITCVTSEGWHVMGVMDSPIAGGDGNQEFLLAAERRS